MKDRWTSTKDALPKERGEYIVMIEGASIPTALEYYPPNPDIPPEFGDLWLDQTGAEYSVIAWMDFPDPYCEEGEALLHLTSPEDKEEGPAKLYAWSDCIDMAVRKEE